MAKENQDTINNLINENEIKKKEKKYFQNQLNNNKNIINDLNNKINEINNLLNQRNDVILKMKNEKNKINLNS